MKLRHILNHQYTHESPYAPRQNLPWIKSPLEEEKHLSQVTGQIPPSNEVSGAKGTSTTDSLNLSSPIDEERSIQIVSKLKPNGEQPRFKVHHESSHIELFYDLFFVANLATFTANHPVNDRRSIASYMGFFSLLWFTWFQTSLHDVRFAFDSVFSRVCKAIRFGTMTGFASSDQNPIVKTLKAIIAPLKT